MEAGGDRTNRFLGVLRPLHGDVVISQIGFQFAFGFGSRFENLFVDQLELVAFGGADRAFHGRVALPDVAASVADEVILAHAVEIGLGSG